MKVDRTKWRNNPKPLAAGRMVVAIGDVHGCDGHLRAMYKAVAEDVADLDPPETSCILIGDLIDRGPSSRECLEMAADGLSAFLPGHVIEDVVLIGNHDVWLRMALDGEMLEMRDIMLWLGNGGQETMSSFRVDESKAIGLAARFRDSMSEAASDLVGRMTRYHRIGDLFFVHAGIDPRRSLEHQDEETMVWIRDAFLNARDWPFDVLVVHGHTIEIPDGEPAIHPHRIGIDSGAFITGVLTAVEFLGDQLRFVTVTDAASIPPSARESPW